MWHRAGGHTGHGGIFACWSCRSLVHSPLPSSDRSRGRCKIPDFLDFPPVGLHGCPTSRSRRRERSTPRCDRGVECVTCVPATDDLRQNERMIPDFEVEVRRVYELAELTDDLTAEDVVVGFTDHEGYECMGLPAWSEVEACLVEEAEILAHSARPVRPTGSRR